MKFRLSLFIPFLLLLSVFVSSTLIYWWQNKSAEESIRATAKEQLNLDITRLQNILYNRMIESDVAAARLSLSVSAMDQSMTVLMLTGDNNQVIIANRFSWQGKQARNFSGYDESIALAVRNANSPRLFYSDTDTGTLLGYYPVVLQLDSQLSRAVKKVGVLYVEYSIVSKLVIAKNNAFQLFIVILSMMLIATMIVAILLHFFVSRRLAELTQASRSLAKGNVDVRANVSGKDELGVLASSFNEMALHIHKNISQLEKAESELLVLNDSLEVRIQERTALLIEAQRIAKLGNWVWNLKDKSSFWSDEIYSILGLSRSMGEVQFDVVQSLIHPDDRERFDLSFKDALEAGEQQKIEYRVIRPDRKECWVRLEMVIVRDENGEPVSYKGTLQDITERKREREEHDFLERQLQQTQKMESLGQLTGGIAHDFNNMLASIIGFTDMAQNLDVIDPRDKLSGYLSIVMQSSERARDLVAQMLAFSRTHENLDQKERLSVTAVLNDTFNMLRPLIPSSIELRLIEPEEEYFIRANDVMLGQVIMNLCLNARDAMSDSHGSIIIELSQETIDGKQCVSCHKSINGKYIQISVNDNGTGIKESILNSLFEPFFTTKEVGKGTGMGLSMVHGIVHKHDGHILMHSQEGVGTNFSLLFPVDTEVEDKTKDKLDGVSQIMQGHDELILVVDDELSIALYLEEYLSEHGYQVVSMNDSKEALDYFTDNHDLISLVITDYTMPRLTGVQMTEAMHKVVPDFPVILVTGYSDYVDEKIALQKHIRGFLNKPIDSRKLLLYIHQFALKKNSN